jgi:hypothetical protein
LLSPESLIPVLCLCALQARFHIVLSSLIDAATVIWFFAADTSPLSLLFDGCFAVDVRADALPPCRFRRAPPMLAS